MRANYNLNTNIDLKSLKTTIKNRNNNLDCRLEFFLYFMAINDSNQYKNFKFNFMRNLILNSNNEKYCDDYISFEELIYNLVNLYKEGFLLYQYYFLNYAYFGITDFKILKKDIEDKFYYDYLVENGVDSRKEVYETLYYTKDSSSDLFVNTMNYIFKDFSVEDAIYKYITMGLKNINDCFKNDINYIESKKGTCKDFKDYCLNLNNNSKSGVEEDVLNINEYEDINKAANVLADYFSFEGFIGCFFDFPLKEDFSFDKFNDENGVDFSKFFKNK